jgi:uncharacterized membrane protein YadS
MQTFARILSLLPVVIYLIVAAVFFKRLKKKKEEQRALPWYEKDVFWVSAIFSLTLIFAVVLWIVSYKIV